MIVAALGSGSAGNSYFFESEGTRILVDAGFGPRETSRRLQKIDRSIESIQAIVITHEHYDHIRGAERIGQKYGIPVFVTEGTLKASSIDWQSTPFAVFQNNTSFRIGDLNVHARRTLHDAADPACFVIEAGDGTRFGIASDLGCVDKPVLEHLKNCDGLLFEANHDVDMLRSGTYPWGLKRRILSRYGHLSNDDSMLALRDMVGADLKNLCLIHLSEKNNHESIVRTMAESLVTLTGAKLQLDIARQKEPMPVMHVARRGGRAPRPVAAQMSLF